MIGYIRGNVSFLFSEYCFIDVNGVGYRIFIPGSTHGKLSVGSTVLLFTYMHVREDAILLYGFFTQEEYDIFLLLLSVGGIGPKVALNVLSVISPTEFITAISHKNVAALTRIPGIGKKTAERMILELKEKVGSIHQEEVGAEAVDDGELPIEDVRNQALLALQTLGYHQAEAIPVLKKISTGYQTVEEVIRLALKELGRR